MSVTGSIRHPLPRRPLRAHSPLSVLMQNRCLKPWWEWEQVITSGLEHPMSTFLVPTMMLQP